MKNKIIDIDALARYLNKSQFTTTDDEIAMYLFEHRDEIKEKTLKEFVVNSYISQPSFTRFFKKNGVEKYQDFRYGMIEYNVKLDQHIKYLRSLDYGSNLDEMKQIIIDKQIQTLEMLKKLDNSRLEGLVEEISNYRRVIFIGSELSMSLLRVIQRSMIYYGVNCYTLADPIGQEYMVENSNKDDLIICVSMKGRWFNHVDSESTIDKLFHSKCFKMLWTIDRHHQNKEKFNSVYYFGESMNEFDYTQLENFAFLFNQLYIQYNNKNGL